MAAHGTESTDMGLGLAIVFALLAVASAVAMYVTAPAAAAGTWFLGALLFGVLVVFVVHRWDA